MVVEAKKENQYTDLSVRYVNGASPNVNALIAAGGEVYKFAVQNVPINQSGLHVIPEGKESPFEIESKINTLIDLNPIDVNKGQSFFYRLNSILPDAGIYIGCAHLGVNKIVISFKRNKKKAKPLSKAEILGRLVNAGFSIIDYRQVESKLYYCVMKTGNPLPETTGSTKWVIPLKRIGQHGKMVKIYKFRTMYPYSEFLQDFVVNLNGYNEKGKPKNDFRLTKIGRLIRKHWIDELPQIINLLRGELVIIGVRPLSKTRFNELPEDVRRVRVKFKPGCIPPYVALRMPDSLANIEAERIYFKEKAKSYYWTDIKYFIWAVLNIVSGRIRSS